MSFARHLKSWRLSRGLTQEGLALRSGVPRPNLVALERGKRECTLTTLSRLAFALGVSPGKILDQGPPSAETPDLQRHEIDRIARCLIEGERGLRKSLRQVWEQAALQAVPLLQAAGVPPRYRIRKRRVLQNKRVVDRVLRRLSKLLPGCLSEEHP